MLTDRDRVVVEDAVCSRCSVPTKWLHHRDFPEIRAECSSIAEGAAHLAERLAHYRDDAPGAWHRETIALAIKDVREFLAAVAGEGRASCRCDPQVLRAEGREDALGTTPLGMGTPRPSDHAR